MRKKLQNFKIFESSPKNFTNSIKPLSSIKSPLSNKILKRSSTLPKENIETIIIKYEENQRKSLISPLYTKKNEQIEKMPPPKLFTCRTVKICPIKLKSRFKDLKISTQKIPQNDYLVYLLDKIPTFDMAMKDNIEKNKKKMKSLIRPIAEDQNETSYEKSA